MDYLISLNWIRRNNFIRKIIQLVMQIESNLEHYLMQEHYPMN